MTYKEYEENFSNVVRKFNSHEMKAWNYFKSVYETIPKEHSLKILLEVIYTYYNFEPDEFAEYLEYILDSETEEDFESRISENSQRIKEMGYKIDKNGFIKIYRGQTDDNETVENAISWSCDKDVATWFAMRFAKTKPAYLYSTEIHISDILCVSDDRNEKEIMVTPTILDLDKDDIKRKDVKYSENFMKKWRRKKEEHLKIVADKMSNSISTEEKQKHRNKFADAQLQLAKNLYEQGKMTHENYLELCDQINSN